MRPGPGIRTLGGVSRSTLWLPLLLLTAGSGPARRGTLPPGDGGGAADDTGTEAGAPALPDTGEPGDDAGPGDATADATDGATDTNAAPDTGETEVECGPPDVATDAAADAGPDADAAPPECLEHADCDDGLFCNGAEGCSEGRCFPSPRPPCRDRVACTTDACDEETDSCHFEPDDGTCAPDQVCDRKVGCFREGGCGADDNCDDGLLCNGAEACLDGQCVPGEPPDCDDGIACTEDTCVEQLGWCENVPHHRLCLPTELCNVDEGCIPRPPCDRDDECDDGWYCNGTEFCDDEVDLCSAGAPPDVPDEVPCTIDVCSEERSMVLHVPDNARCSDGEFCNGSEVCHPEHGCQLGAAPPRSDGVGCTEEVCNEALDFIEHLPVHEECDDGLFCNGAEVCHPIDGCIQVEPVEVNDGVGCTVDSCSEVHDEVLHVPTDELCGDGLFCNGAETCDPEHDCQDGVPPAVEDGVGCTADRCDEAADEVVHEPQDDRCDDGQFCNGVETCDLEHDCQDGEAPALEDAHDCTVDRCDEVADEVVHEPEDARCDDGQFCNGVVTGDAAGGGRAGCAPVPADAPDCTADGCDEEADEVVHEPLNERCDDGLFCNGAETCDADLGCLPGQAPFVPDSLDCTDDRCDEDLDRIVHTPVDARCADELFCNGAEVCDPEYGCKPGVAPALDDLVGCTDDRCDEAADEVVHEPDDGACAQGEPCEAGMRCDALADCVPAPAPDDGEVCLEAPRSICLDGECQESLCGDGFEDGGAGEECDDGGRADGDGCDADCQAEGPGGISGLYDVAPSVHYSCAWGLVNVNVRQLRFTLAGNALVVTGAPTTMEQSPAPAGPDFSVTGTIPGGCAETYSLAGSFQDEDTWTGDFTIRFAGPQCGLTECRDQPPYEVTGTRVQE